MAAMSAAPELLVLKILGFTMTPAAQWWLWCSM
jgi:hypothetical protein